MSSEPLSEMLAKLDATDPHYATVVVERLLTAARSAGASDVHFQPSAGGLEVTWRIDGVLLPVASMPIRIAPNIVARLKVLAELLTYRTDVPQEGRIRGVPGEVEMRVSTFPTLFGEKAVVRMFASPGLFLRLDDLGLPESRSETGWGGCWARPPGRSSSPVRRAAERQPRSTRACVSSLHSRAVERSLATLEDPIESVVPGVAQSQVNLAAGLTLESGLKSLLRQDPEVIAIGEIRDRSTAETALQAAADRAPDPDDLPRRQRLRGHRQAARHGDRALRRPQRAARRRVAAPRATALLVLVPCQKS